MRARKRKRPAPEAGSSLKRQKVEHTSAHQVQNSTAIGHPVLNKYYAQSLTLRDYLCSQLNQGSKRRLRILNKLGRQQSKSTSSSQQRYERAIPLLDTVVVGIQSPHKARSCEYDQAEKAKEYKDYSQHLAASGSATKSQLGTQCVSWPEVVDFCIWLLFNRKYPSHQKPPHVLCRGFLRTSATWHNREDRYACDIPGLVCMSPNEHVKALNDASWRGLFSLLGGEAEQIMIHLITNYALFVPISPGSDSLYQLSGYVLSDLKPLNESSKAPSYSAGGVLHKNSEIRFVRSRILYARAALNAKGEVAFGLRHIHVLNRYPDSSKLEHTLHVMKYMFPRQFGLHNVFTSKPDPKETAQPFQDYTLREHEIARVDLAAKLKLSGRPWMDGRHRIPKRLRCLVMQIVQGIQRRHSKCSYTQLLAHYCPMSHTSQESPALNKPFSSSQKIEQTGFRRLCTPVACVSAFSRAVIARIFPAKVLGGHENQQILHRHIDNFLRSRRYESSTLESVLTGVKVKNVSWLLPPGYDEDSKMPQSDRHKRIEILSEFIYYVFDSFLIPLIRTNFHVTESSADKNRLYYFRHDVWRRMTEPALGKLKLSMFEEIKRDNVGADRDKNKLGYSQLRLLPKEKGMRPISNLRRRAQLKQNGTATLGKSVNSMLSPVFHVLNYEKTNQPDKLGASLFSVSGMYQKLREFRAVLGRAKNQVGKLYFVKVDVQGCFDSIPQLKMLELVQNVLSADEYTIANFAEMKHSHIFKVQDRGDPINPVKKFTAYGYAGKANTSFADLITDKLGPELGRSNKVYVDSVVPRRISKREVLQLLEEHIRRNTVKIGKKLFRQKQGIPQGSVISSLLCSFFYGELELKHMGFLKKEESVLFRLIDDFLLITSNIDDAKRFLDLTHSGIPEYGVSVSGEKSLVNFEAEVKGRKIPRLASTASGFPYCGLLIEEQTLNVRKDADKVKTSTLANGLTIERCKRPGYSFRRKMLSTLKIHMHTMLLDTSHNARRTVMENLFQAGSELARKSYEYTKCLGKQQRLKLGTFKQLVEDACGLMFAMMKSKKHRQRSSGYQCAISREVTRWMILHAFLSVFRGKQSRFEELMPWLEECAMMSSRQCLLELGQLREVVVAPRVTHISK